MAEFEAHSRREVWRARRAWGRHYRRLVVRVGGIALGCAALVTVELVLLPAPAELRWYLIGAFHATLVAILVWFTNLALFATHQRAIRHLRGGWGEESGRVAPPAPGAE